MVVGYYLQGEQDVDGCQDGDYLEQCVQIQLVGDNWFQYYGDGEGDVEVDVDKGYCFGVVLFVGEIGKQGYNCGGDGVGVLQGVVKNDVLDGVGECGDDVVEYEDKQVVDD